MSPEARPSVVGVLLAGGLARRMGGGDKCLRDLGGKPLLVHVADRMAPQVDRLILNANGDPDRFKDFGLTVVPDVIEGFAGPLAGVLTGMDWTRANAPDCPWIVTVPTDAPFVPMDLVARLLDVVASQDAQMACAVSGGRTHPVVGLWPVALAEELRRAMTEEDMRKIDRWTARYALAAVEWPADPVDPFFNANRPDDLETARSLLADA
jgi:molybdopterin-guanine dinucleotide biosynthesis protein A